MFTPRYATEDDLELTISIEKETINKTQEPSNKIYISLTNIGDEKIRVFHDFSIEQLLAYHIITPSNITIYANLYEVQHEYRYITLSPSEKLETTIDIFDYNYVIDYENEYNWNETGLFKIQFSYLNEPNLETIESNVIEFWYEE